MQRVYKGRSPLFHTYYYYLAEELKKERQHLEKYEMINTKWLSIKQALKMIKQNKIIDGKTIQGVLYYYNFVKMKK